MTKSMTKINDLLICQLWWKILQHKLRKLVEVVEKVSIWAMIKVIVSFFGKAASFEFQFDDFGIQRGSGRAMFQCSMCQTGCEHRHRVCDTVEVLTCTCVPACV